MLLLPTVPKDLFWLQQAQLNRVICEGLAVSCVLRSYGQKSHGFGLQGIFDLAAQSGLRRGQGDTQLKVGQVFDGQVSVRQLCDLLKQGLERQESDRKSVV